MLFSAHHGDCGYNSSPPPILWECRHPSSGSVWHAPWTLSTCIWWFSKLSILKRITSTVHTFFSFFFPHLSTWEQENYYKLPRALHWVDTTFRKHITADVAVQCGVGRPYCVVTDQNTPTDVSQRHHPSLSIDVCFKLVWKKRDWTEMNF